jgi:N-acetyl-gamma-glutamyl-phosphate reductase common form
LAGAIGMKPAKLNVAVVGARGYVGKELLCLLDRHGQVETIAAYSREYKGKKIADIVEGFSNKRSVYQNAEFDQLTSENYDVLFLALPNGVALNQQKLWKQISKNTCIIDLSSDFRFEDEDWLYCQPETCQQAVIGQKLISNPGCYATAAQLGILPLLGLLNSPPVIFGVSGYSGAGSKPCDKNNLDLLHDNLMAYKLVDHIHEAEISRVIGQKVYFTPHVASFFRGIHLTINLILNKPLTAAQINKIYQEYYQEAELINTSVSIPEVRNVQNTHEVNIGGFTVQQDRVVLCVTIDNLLKGSATQAIQNMNLSFSNTHDLKINSFLNNGNNNGQ